MSLLKYYQWPAGPPKPTQCPGKVAYTEVGAEGITLLQEMAQLGSDLWNETENAEKNELWGWKLSGSYQEEHCQARMRVFVESNVIKCGINSSGLYRLIRFRNKVTAS